MHSKVLFHHHRNPWFLFLSIISLCSLTGLIISVSPLQTLQLAWLQVQIFPLFFVLLAIFLYTLITFITKRKKHAILITLFVIIYLSFRLNNLTHPFFLVLLSALFVTLELLLSYRK